MANQWFRVWHGMPQDMKFKTVARVSGQPLSLVLSVYVTLLDAASQNVTRGHANVTLEDVASHFDVTLDQVSQIYDAMQGRLLDGFEVTGWGKRQPKREDSGDDETGAKSAASRKRAQRDREKLAEGTVALHPCHEMSRNVTTDKDKDKDKDKEIKTNIVELFEFWKVTLCHKKARLDEKRSKAISRAIRLGYSEEDLKAAIVGCSKTPHNMGQNDRGEKYDSIDLIFRDADHIDRFIRNSGLSGLGAEGSGNDPMTGYKIYGENSD